MRLFKIGARLSLSFAIIVFLMLLGSAVSLWQLNVVRTQAQHLHRVDTELEAILRVQNSILILKDRVGQLIEAEDVEQLTREASIVSDDLVSDLDDAIEILKTSSAIGKNGDYDIYLSQLDVTRASLQGRVDSIIALARANNWTAAKLRLDPLIGEESQRIQELVNQISETVAAEQDLAFANMERAERQALAAVGITGLLTLAAAGLLGYVVTRSIAQPLAQLSAGAKALARREFDHRVVVAGDDELSQLSGVFNDSAAQLAELYDDLEEAVWQRTKALQENSEELHHRYLQLEISIAVGQWATSILDLDTLLDQVVELIRERYGYYFVGVFLLDESGTHLRATAGTGDAGRLLCQRGFQLKIGQEGIIGWVAKHRRPLRIDEVSEDSRYIKIDIIPDTRSELALPLAIADTTLGVLDLQSDRSLAFRMEDMPVLQSLADQVAIAIQNATLYQREKHRRQLAETLYHVGRALTRTLDLNQVLDLILEHLATIVPYDRAALMLTDGEELEFVATRGFPPEIRPLQLRVPINQNEDDVFWRICQTQQPLMIDDVLGKPGWQNIAGLRQARAWLGLPLIRLDRVIGMLSLTREIPNAYGEDQIKLATSFAGQAAIALENARLYDKITRFTQQLEDMVRERTEAVQVAYAQLEHLDRVKSDFIQIAAHELRTPLTVLRGYSQMLLKDQLIQNNVHHFDIISTIHTGAMRLHEIVNSMLDITKIDSRSLELYPEPVAIAPVLEIVCQKFEEPLRERNQALVVENIRELPTIEADPDALRKVFFHLITNAIKYTPDGGRIRITGRPLVEQPQDTSGLEVIVCDTGIGIDPDYHDLIFTKFYQTGELALHSSSQTNFKGAGPGLGLAIVRGIVEAHQGRIWVESEGYSEETLPGSQFHIVLPLRQERRSHKRGSTTCTRK